MRAVRPLNDYIFKKVFGEKGDEVQLLALLNAILSKNPEQKRLETIGMKNVNRNATRHLTI